MIVINAKFSPMIMQENFVIRTNLLNLLNKDFKKNIILINAPAGYGKSTILSQYIANTKETVMWYQIDKFDNNIHSFMNTFVEGVKRALNKKNLDMLRLTHDNLSELNLRGLVANLLNYLEQNCLEKICIIFDDFHFVSDPKIYEIVELFLHYMPPNIRVIISSRVRPEIELSHFITSDRLIEIDANTLKFSLEEEKEYLKELKMPYEIELIECDAIRKNNGWPFGLNLLKHASSEHININFDINKLYKKCFDNIFDSGKEQKFLLTTSMLEVLDIDACNFVTGENNSEQTLKKLSNKGLYITKNHDGFYKYHDLFKEYLMDKVKNKEEIYYKIAQFYISNNDILKAIDYLLLCEDYSKADLLIKENNYKYISVVYNSQLISWNSKISKIAVENYGSLCLIKSLVYIKMGNIIKGEVYLNKAKKLLEDTKDEEGLIRADIIRLRILRHINIPNVDLLDVYKDAKNIYNKLSNRELIEKLDIINERLHLAVRVSKVKDELKYLRELVNEIEERNMKPWELELLGLYEYANYLMGDYKAAMETQKKYRHIISPLNSILFTLRIYVVWGQLEKGKEIVLKEIEVAKRFALSSNLAELYSILAEIEFHLGKYNSAERYFKEALSLYDKDKSNLYNLSIFTYGLFMVFLGRKDEGLELIHNYYEEVPSSKILTYMMGDMFLAQIYMIIGDYNKAIGYAEKSLPISENYNTDLYVNTLCAVIATSYIKLGNEEKAYVYAERCMELSSKHNYIQDFITFTEFYEPLFEFCLKNEIQVNFINRLISKSKDINLSNVESEDYIYVSFFGDNIVKTKGKLIRWRTTKARNIFFYVLYNNNTGVTKEKLIDTFFSKYDYDKASNNLRATMTYIRKALRKVNVDNIVKYVNGRYFINDKNIKTDISIFENIINQLKNYDFKNVELCQNLCDVYKGSFFEDIDLHEYIFIRDKYYNMFEKAVMSTVINLNNKGRYKEALNFINILISHQKFNEQYYKLKIKIYNRMGDELNALKVKEELNIIRIDS